MSIRVSLFIFATLTLMIGVVISVPWTNSDTLVASMKGGNPSTLTTSLDSNLVVGPNEFTKTVNTGLQATGARNVAFSSGTTLTKMANGHTYTTSNSMSEQLTFPKDSNVGLSQIQMTDFTNLQNPINDFSSSMWTDDPEFKKLHPSGSLDDLMKNFFGQSGEATDLSILESVRNLGYLGSHDVTNSDSSNGVTCVWGEKQNTIIDIAKLAAL